MACQLKHIPARLHSDDRQNNSLFSVNEELYRRCKKDHAKNFVGNITLTDISVNRSGNPIGTVSLPNDVLLKMQNIEDGDSEVFDDDVVTLVIKELTEDGQYIKEEQNTKNVPGQQPFIEKCKIHLQHKKEECNYSHCAFEIFYNEVEVTYDNYKSGLGKSSKLKDWCRHEIAKMIKQEEVRINLNNNNGPVAA